MPIISWRTHVGCWRAPESRFSGPTRSIGELNVRPSRSSPLHLVQVWRLQRKIYAVPQRKRVSSARHWIDDRSENAKCWSRQWQSLECRTRPTAGRRRRSLPCTRHALIRPRALLRTSSSASRPFQGTWLAAHDRSDHGDRPARCCSAAPLQLPSPQGLSDFRETKLESTRSTMSRWACHRWKGPGPSDRVLSLD